jgi:glycosyltransferase involved in cell wall biosynthesis
MIPKVSICVPNLNTLPFLPERFETIFNQSFQDWELLVYDGYSTDGAWEYISRLAAGESRMRIWQGPREGTPGSWTPCVREASGEYVYIATSDDTMPPDCLEKLVAALETHPECGLAHCSLRTIDEKGREILEWWWSRNSAFGRSSGEFVNRPHIRRAPFDGLLHLLGETVYISITQLLIRRSLFDRIGLFESRWGSVGDFNWNMRAALVANTVHVPDTWGGWRIHSSQATAGVGLRSIEHRAKVEAMIEHAIENVQEILAPKVRRSIRNKWARRARDFRELGPALEIRPGSIRRRAFLLRRILSGSWAARQHFRARLRGPQFVPQWGPEAIREWLREVGIFPVLLPAERNANCIGKITV